MVDAPLTPVRARTRSRGVSSRAQENRRPTTHLRADIQGLRGLAVLIGLAYHAGFELPGGYIAFDIFFVVSGFVIAGMLRRELARTGSIDLSSFYRRRFKRLVPSLAVGVLATAIASAVLLSPVNQQGTVVQSALGALLLYANYAVPHASGNYFSEPAKLNPLLHTWSLSLEEQVYLVFPVLLLVGFAVARRWSRKVACAIGIVAVACLASVVWAHLTSTGNVVLGMPPSLGGYHGPLSRFWEFGAGAVAALSASRVQRRVPTEVRSVLSAVAIVSLVVCVFVLDKATPYPDLVTMWPVAAIVCILLHDHRSWSGRLFETKALVHVGDMSYSWYVWHWPIISITDSLTDTHAPVVIAACLSYIPARIAFLTLERPFTGPGGPAVNVRFAATFLMPPLVFLAAMSHAQSHSYWSSHVRALSVAARPHLAVTACSSPSSVGACRLNGAATGAPVYLIGDSNAAQYGEGLLAALAPPGRPLVVSYESGCLPLPVEVISGSVDDLPRTPAYATRCRAAEVRTTRMLSHAEHGDVIIAFGGGYLADARTALRGQDGLPQASEAAKKRFLVQALTARVLSLQAEGHRVTLAFPIPVLEGVWDQRRCTTFSMLRGTCAFDKSRTALLRKTTTARAAIAEVAAVTGARTFDPIPFLCSPDRCASNFGSEVQYQDPGHISALTSARMAAGWRSVLAAAS